MANKTKIEAISVPEYLAGVEPAQKREDAARLEAIFREETGIIPSVWTGGMIGYGQYNYTYESGHSGTAFMLGFAPRRQNLALYLWLPEGDREVLLNRLGKVRAASACVYINKLADIDEDILREWIRLTLAYMKDRYPNSRME